MRNKIKRTTTTLTFVLLSLLQGWAQRSYQASTIDMELIQRGESKFPSGFQPDRSSWDAQTVSNTYIKRFNGKYYLYYCGSVDVAEGAKVKGTLSRRDRIQQNQKLGVLCFNSIKELLLR